jgi:RHS repeat-associated protein
LPPDGIISVPSEIVQEEHYYPFGMKMTGPWMGGAAGAKSAYQYNGIEHVDDFDLNVNMAMYRTLDPVIGRWWGVDPKGEAVKSHSPYVSMGNSPMLNSDPKGDIFGPVLALGLQSMLVSGARSSSQGESFIGGALQGGAIFAANSIASAGIGGIFQGVGGFGKEALRAGVHGLSGGTFSVLQGGSFGSGFAAAALSSGFGSALHGASSGLQIFAGGIAGGIGSVLAGGNFIEGFFQGAIVTGMNHIQHQSLAGDPPWKYNGIEYRSKGKLYAAILLDTAADQFGITDLIVLAAVIDNAGFVPKRFQAKGASSGTSLASKYGSKLMPWKMPKQLPTHIRGGTVRGTRVFGRFLGRMAGPVGWGLLTYDVGMTFYRTQTTYNRIINN